MTKEEIKDTICNKCVWKDYRLDDRCPYVHEFVNGRCSAFSMTAYHRKKEREEKNARLLYNLVEVNGITPKHKIGDVVYLKCWPRSVEKTSIRELVVDDDCRGYRYKVKGHTEYTYTEDSVYSTEQECLLSIIEDFVKETQRVANHLKLRAETIGLPIEKINILSK